MKALFDLVLRCQLAASKNQFDPSVVYTSAGDYQTRPFATNYNSIGVSSLAAYYLLGLVTGGPYNGTHWGSTAQDDILFDAVGELDAGKPREKWHAVQQLQRT